MKEKYLSYMLTTLLLRYQFEDAQLLQQASYLNQEAQKQISWHSSFEYLKEAQKRYLALREAKQEKMLEHARVVQSLFFIQQDYETVSRQLNYSKKIYKTYNSYDDLYSLALRAKEISLTFPLDLDNLKFLGYSREILETLDKKSDLKALALLATVQSSKIKNPQISDKFSQFGVETFQRIG